MRRLTVLVSVFLIPALGRGQTHSLCADDFSGVPSAIAFDVNSTQLAYAPEPGAMRERPRIAEPPDDRDDPAYAAYKEAYGLVLQERWDAARKKFAEMLKRYTRSRYRDDAEYWSAYTLKHTDRLKAIKAYEEFLHKHPRSTYLDDVVADLAELNARPPLPAEINDSLRAALGHLPEAMRARDISLRTLSLNLRKMERSMRRGFFVGQMGHGAPMVFSFDEPDVGKPIDPETRLKIEALRALGDNPDDPRSFSTLKDIALDMRQPRQLRSVALTSLARFKDSDLIPVLAQVAETDTDAAVQGSAVYCIASSGRDRKKTVDVLGQIYEKTPPERTGQRQTILYVIGSIGSDQAITFLAQVAKTAKDPDIALTAIDGIGEAGGDKEKAVQTLATLYAATPAAQKDQRETILYTAADIGTDRAVDFLADVALHDKDYDARGSAVYLLGTIGGEKARTVLYRVLKGQ